MKYEIEIERSALKALQKIPAKDRNKIIKLLIRILMWKAEVSTC